MRDPGAGTDGDAARRESRSNGAVARETRANRPRRRTSRSRFPIVREAVLRVRPERDGRRSNRHQLAQRRERIAVWYPRTRPDLGGPSPCPIAGARPVISARCTAGRSSAPLRWEGSSSVGRGGEGPSGRRGCRRTSSIADKPHRSSRIPRRTDLFLHHAQAEDGLPYQVHFRRAAGRVVRQVEVDRRHRDETRLRSPRGRSPGHPRCSGGRRRSIILLPPRVALLHDQVAVDPLSPSELPARPGSPRARVGHVDVHSVSSADLASASCGPRPAPSAAAVSNRNRVR